MMKKLSLFFFVVLILITTSSLYSQGIQSKSSLDSLRTVIATLKSDIKKNKKSEQLWRKYYEVKKQLLGSASDRSLQNQQRSLDSILSEMNSAIPNSFVYNLCQWNSVLLSTEKVPFFLQAQKLQPNDPAIVIGGLYVALMTNNDSAITNAAKRIYTMAAIPSQMMNFAYNTLISIPANGIVVVDSDLLFEALVVLQHTKNIRKEVQILNQKTLAENNCRTIVFGKNSFQNFSVFYNNINTAKNLSEPFFNTLAVLVKYSQKPICFAGNFSGNLLAMVKDSLYVIGTVYLYSTQVIDNAKIIRNNWSKFRLDYLRMDLYGEQFDDSESIKKETFPIYISCATILYNNSKEKEDLHSVAQYRGIALSIAKQIGAYDDVEAYFLAIEKKKQN